MLPNSSTYVNSHLITFDIFLIFIKDIDCFNEAVLKNKSKENNACPYKPQFPCTVWDFQGFRHTDIFT